MAKCVTEMPLVYLRIFFFSISSMQSFIFTSTWAMWRSSLWLHSAWSVNAPGFRAKREENGFFNNIDREFNDRQRRMRPDLSIFDLPGPNRKIILDISNICPIPIFGTQQYSRNDALIIHDERMEKFNAISTANGI